MNYDYDEDMAQRRETARRKQAEREQLRKEMEEKEKTRQNNVTNSQPSPASLPTRTLNANNDRAPVAKGSNRNDKRKREPSSSREWAEHREIDLSGLSSLEPQNSNPRPRRGTLQSQPANNFSLYRRGSAAAPRDRQRSRGDISESTVSAQPSPRSPLDSGEVERKPPDWYTQIKKDGFNMRQVTVVRANAPIVASLSTFKELIDACKKARLEPLSMAFKDLRTHLHKLEFLQVDRYILKDRRMLDNQNGLPQIFDARFSQGVQYPWDIKADAQELYNRWCLEVFSIDLLRGITKAKIKGKEDKRSADRIEKDFPGRVLANFHGQGHLINGQWWPTQLCSLRDGAHGSSQGGIFGEAGKGCFSIVLSAGFHYGDIDNGDTIWYSGTESSNETPTENTMRLIETAEMLPNEKQPVRVIRSWNMKKENPYRPQRGFRYDGLYDVVQKRLDEKKKAMYSFYLVRRAGQDPIRYQGVEVRPTTQEIDAYDKLRAADLPVVKW